MSVAISNTGPLIAFAKIGRIDLLQSLFSEILIPAEVRDELSASPKLLPGNNIPELDKFRVLETGERPDALLIAELDSGEASVIQAALEHREAEVLLDEKKARRIATGVYGLNVLGSGGLLLRAKKRGLVSAIRPLLKAMRANGYFVSDAIERGILAAANEAS